MFVLLWLCKLLLVANLCLVSSLYISFLLNSPTTLSVVVHNFPNVQIQSQVFCRFYSFSLMWSPWTLLLDGLLFRSVAQYCSGTYYCWSAMLDSVESASFSFFVDFFLVVGYIHSAASQERVHEREIFWVFAHLKMSFL